MENTDDLIISRSVIRKIIDDPDCKNQGFMFFNELSENANFMEALQARNYNDLQIEHLELLFKSFMRYPNNPTWALVTSYSDEANVFVQDHCLHDLEKVDKFDMADRSTNLGYSKWVDSFGNYYHCVQVIDDLDTDQSAEPASEIWFFEMVI